MRAGAALANARALSVYVSPVLFNVCAGVAGAGIRGSDGRTKITGAGPYVPAIPKGARLR